jgi:hypothetical protein
MARSAWRSATVSTSAVVATCTIRWAGRTRGLGDAALVAAPAHPALDAVAGLGVIGAADRQRGGRLFGLAEPAQPLLVTVVLLQPQRTQSLHRRDLPQPRRCVAGVDDLQQHNPVGADSHGSAARTRAYAARRTAEGLSKPEVMGCVNRYLAREVYHALKADFEAPRTT